MYSRFLRLWPKMSPDFVSVIWSQLYSLYHVICPAGHIMQYPALELLVSTSVGSLVRKPVQMNESLGRTNRTALFLSFVSFTIRFTGNSTERTNKFPVPLTHWVWLTQLRTVQWRAVHDAIYRYRKPGWMNKRFANDSSQFSWVSGSTESDWLSWEPCNAIPWCDSPLPETMLIRERLLPVQSSFRWIDSPETRLNWEESFANRLFVQPGFR
jgi:hypothetical protein